MPKLSAGILLYRINNKNLEVLLVHPGGPFWAKKDNGAWSLPKGEYAAEEDPWAAAQREFSEELGCAAPTGERIELGEVKYSNKILTAWAVQGDLDPTSIKSNTFTMQWPPKSDQTQEFPEVDRAEWCSVAVAQTKLVPGQVALVTRLAEQLDMTPPAQTKLL